MWARLRAVAAIIFIVAVAAFAIVVIPETNPTSRAAVIGLSVVLTGLQLWRLVALWRVDRRSARSEAETQPPPPPIETPAVRPSTVRPAYITPFELPPVPELIGRNDEIALIRAMLTASASEREHPRTVALHGDPGVGKTALAIRAAYAAADQFPGGILYADLQGHQHSDEATTILLRGFVDSLLGADEPRPTELPVLRDLYRTLTGEGQRGAHVLVVLDGVESVALAQELMPSSPTCAVLMTCRQPPDLPWVEPIEIQPLKDKASMDLFTQLVTVPHDGEKAALEMVRRAAGYPLALQLTAAALSNGQNWPATVIATTMLRQPADPSKDPRHHALDLSFALLADDERRALRALGLLKQPVFSPWMLVVLLAAAGDPGVDDSTARRLCDRLVNARLLEHATEDPTGVAEFRVLEHVHDYAAALWPPTDLHTRRDAVIGLLDEAREARSLQPLLETLNTEVYAALERGELTNALNRARDTLSLARDRVHSRGRGQSDDAEHGMGLALAALAEVLAEVGGMDDAMDMAQLARVGRHPDATARALRCQGRLLWRQRRLGEAVTALEQARSIAREIPPGGEQIRIVRELAVARALSGEVDEASRLLGEVPDLLADVPERDAVRSGLVAGLAWARSIVLLETFDAEHRTKVLDQAQVATDEAAAAARQHGQRLWLAWAGLQQARVVRRRRRMPQAREHAWAALDMFIAMRHRYGAATCRWEIGMIYLDELRYRDALQVLEEARETLATLDDRWVAASVALNLARAQRLHGHIVEAQRELTTALRLYESLNATWSGGEPARTYAELTREQARQVETRRKRTPAPDPLSEVAFPVVTAGSTS